MVLSYHVNLTQIARLRTVRFVETDSSCSASSQLHEGVESKVHKKCKKNMTRFLLPIATI